MQRKAKLQTIKNINKNSELEKRPIEVIHSMTLNVVMDACNYNEFLLKHFSVIVLLLSGPFI